MPRLTNYLMVTREDFLGQIPSVGLWVVVYVYSQFEQVETDQGSYTGLQHLTSLPVLGLRSFWVFQPNIYKMRFVAVLIFLIIKELATLLGRPEEHIIEKLGTCCFAFYEIFTNYLVSLSISFLIDKIWNKNSNRLIELLFSHYYLIIIINETIRIKLCLARS